MKILYNILSIFLIVSVPIICGGNEIKKTGNEIVVCYGGEKFSQQDLSELTQTLNVIHDVPVGKFKEAFIWMFRLSLHDVLSLLEKNNSENSK